MTRRLVLAALAVVPLSAQFWERERHLQFGPPFAWPQTTASTAPGTQVTHDQALQLVKELFSKDIPPIANIDQFRFAPMEKGKVDLVVVGDATGRDFFDAIIAVHCAGADCDTYLTSSDWPNDLTEQLIDPDGEGVDKVVTKHRVLGYEGTQTKPIFTYSIERIKVGTRKKAFDRIVTEPDFFDVTSDYESYYTASLLPKIEEARTVVEGKYGSEEDQAEARAAVQFAYDDYRRRILHDTKAGFDNALKWIGSPYREIQRLAVRTMEETDDIAAASKLKEWSQSKDNNIAEESASALTRWMQTRAQRGK